MNIEVSHFLCISLYPFVNKWANTLWDAFIMVCTCNTLRNLMNITFSDVRRKRYFGFWCFCYHSLYPQRFSLVLWGISRLVEQVQHLFQPRISLALWRDTMIPLADWINFCFPYWTNPLICHRLNGRYCDFFTGTP